MAKIKSFSQTSPARALMIGGMVGGGSVAAAGLSEVCADPSNVVGWVRLVSGTAVTAVSHTLLGKSYHAEGYAFGRKVNQEVV